MQTPEKTEPFVKPTECQQGDPFGQRGDWCSCPGHRMFSTIRAGDHQCACYCHCPQIPHSPTTARARHTNSMRNMALSSIPLPVEARVRLLARFMAMTHLASSRHLNSHSFAWEHRSGPTLQRCSPNGALGAIYFLINYIVDSRKSLAFIDTSLVDGQAA